MWFVERIMDVQRGKRDLMLLCIFVMIIEKGLFHLPCFVFRLLMADRTRADVPYVENEMSVC